MAKRRAPGGGRKPKGPISGNTGYLQARITNELREKLEQAADKNGHSLAQEAQIRLKESFDLPAEIQREWGPPEVKALAQLVSRLVRTVQVEVGGNPFKNSGDLAWHRNPFTHAAVCTAINTLLAHYKPEGPIETPPEVKKRATYVPAEQADMVTTPENVGLSCALGLVQSIAIMQLPEGMPRAEQHYAAGHYLFPRIRKQLGEPNK
jgi:hypothetical protein